MTDQSRRAAAFRDLHRQGGLILPNFFGQHGILPLARIGQRLGAGLCLRCAFATVRAVGTGSQCQEGRAGQTNADGAKQSRAHEISFVG